MPLLTIALITAISIFFVGNIYRAVRVIRMPAHLRWDLYPIPKGPSDKQSYGGSYFEETDWWTKSMNTGRRGELSFLLREVFSLRGVFENFRALWVWSLLLHWGLYLYMASTTMAVAAFANNAHFAFGRTLPLLDFLSVGFGVACIFGVMGSLGLIATRILNSRLKGFSTRTTIFNLCLLVSIFITGLFALFVPDRGLVSELRDVVAWRSASGGHSWPASLHFGLVAFFLVYFPFTHMTHMYMKYFTWHGVRWDDTPTRFDERGRTAVVNNLARWVSWQAPHIHGEKEQSWAEVASSSGQHGKGGHD